ncbi:MAG: histidine triad nucleotide-binding protein [Candidatus Nanopelagicales bacterium]|nr:histidine triad nucleotide-binding protein [Candidatus Nanopelagicales bacterium]
MSQCLFCRIVAGEIPADEVMRTDEIVAFRDNSPQAPVHVLVIPTSHYADARAMSSADPRLAGHLLNAATDVAMSEGLDSGYRIVLNTGDEGGQTIHHVHAHVLGGRALKWPPG